MTWYWYLVGTGSGVPGTALCTGIYLVSFACRTVPGTRYGYLVVHPGSNSLKILLMRCKAEGAAALIMRSDASDYAIHCDKIRKVRTLLQRSTSTIPGVPGTPGTWSWYLYCRTENQSTVDTVPVEEKSNHILLPCCPAEWLMFGFADSWSYFFVVTGRVS